jgi:sortase A
VTRVRILAALLLLACGGSLGARDAYLRAKGRLGAVLIERAFDAHLADGLMHRPWSWADLHPVALLEVERLGVRHHVLSGASGSSLAFGPGHVDGTAQPNGRGNSVLAGHRDRWFAFLEDLEVGDVIDVTTRQSRRTWIVEEIRVVHQSSTRLLDPTATDRLTLITCYPFDALLPSPQRYVILCRPTDRS